MAVALFHGSMLRSRAAATSAPAKFEIRPVGGNGKRATPSALLAAEGIRYVCDWGNDEQPHRMTPKTGELHSLGVITTMHALRRPRKTRAAKCANSRRPGAERYSARRSPAPPPTGRSLAS